MFWKARENFAHFNRIFGCPDSCEKAELISLQNQTYGFHFMSKNTDKSSIVKVKENYYTPRSKAPEDLDLKAELKKF